MIRAAPASGRLYPDQLPPVEAGGLLSRFRLGEGRPVACGWLMAAQFAMPRVAMWRAAMWSACPARPHPVQTNRPRADRFALLICPHSGHACDVYAGSTRTKAIPARAAL